MVRITHKDFEIELKKRGWEQYRDFLFSELEKGRNLRDILKDIGTMDREDFIDNLKKPVKL